MQASKGSTLGSRLHCLTTNRQCEAAGARAADAIRRNCPSSLHILARHTLGPLRTLRLQVRRLGAEAGRAHRALRV